MVPADSRLANIDAIGYGGGAGILVVGATGRHAYPMSAVPAELLRLQAELAEARGQVIKLTETVSDQAKTLAAITDDCPPFAPSLAIVYWLYSNTRGAEKGWPKIAQLLLPLISDIGDMPAPKLTPFAWGLHRARRSTIPSQRTGRPVCDAVLNNALSRTKEMLGFAVTNKLIKYNPLSGAKTVPTISRRETWLPLRDLDRLLAAAPLLVDRRLPTGRDNGLRAKTMTAFVLCLHDSMLRFTEAQLLRRDRIGPDGRVELGSRQTKGNKRRVIFLTPRALAAIKELPAQPGNPFVFQDPDEPHPLSNKREKFRPVHERRLHYWFRSLCELAGVDCLVAPGEKRLRCHDLRASGASTADENGARPTAIRDALGHSSLAITEIYLRSGKADNARSVARVIVEATTGGRRGPKRSPDREETFGDLHFSVATKVHR